ncbi:MAG TPA: DUF4329 domain-containing protein [Pseudomonadales bacterium]|nr:DUF4329 domain-containing protein [Pseudomonadales bacterium]
MVGRALVGALLSAIFVPAHASLGACGVVATAVDRERTYSTVVDAVESMRRMYLDESIRSDREFVGAIVEREGSYRTSVGRGCANRDVVRFSVSLEADMRLVAFWHTHGAPANLRELFSPEDVDLVKSTQRDFYLITPHGQLRVLRVDDVARGVTVIRSNGPGLDAPIGSARGDAVSKPRAIDARIARQRAVLPTDSRGDAPVG